MVFRDVALRITGTTQDLLARQYLAMIIILINIIMHSYNYNTHYNYLLVQGYVRFFLDFREWKNL